MTDVGTERSSVGWLPSEFGRTDVSAVVGGAAWVLAVAVADLDAIQRAVSLAVLVVVPLGMGMAATPAFEGAAHRWYTAAVLGQPVAGLLVLASFLLPSGGLGPALAAVPWVAVTGALGVTAITRIRERGLWPLSETLIDAGFAYAIVGAVALVLHHLGITLWFDPVIVFLTAIHFHFAGFVLPVLTGLAGRALGDRVGLGPGFRSLAAVVLLGPAFIAVGISFSPVVEVLAVGGFTVAVGVLGGYIVLRVAPGRPPAQRVLVSVSALALPVSMVLALGYGISTFAGFGLRIPIGTMVSLHGSLNAYWFALVGAVGWRLAVPRAARVE